MTGSPSFIRPDGTALYNVPHSTSAVTGQPEDTGCSLSSAIVCDASANTDVQAAFVTQLPGTHK